MSLPRFPIHVHILYRGEFVRSLLLFPPLSPLALRDSAPLPVYRHAPDLSPDMEVDVRGWWCVRYGDALAWVEASTPADTVQRSLGLAPLGHWTDDARRLVVFLQDAYPDAS